MNTNRDCLLPPVHLISSKSSAHSSPCMPTNASHCAATTSRAICSPSPHPSPPASTAPSILPFPATSLPPLSPSPTVLLAPVAGAAGPIAAAALSAAGEGDSAAVPAAGAGGACCWRRRCGVDGEEGAVGGGEGEGM
ncbi:unnamed protein product [Closterium sp. NIES-54]